MILMSISITIIAILIFSLYNGRKRKKDDSDIKNFIQNIPTDDPDKLRRKKMMLDVWEVGLLISRAEQNPELWADWTKSYGSRDEIFLHFMEIWETNPEVIKKVNEKVGELLERQRIELEELN